MAKAKIGFVGVGGMGQMAHLRNYVNIQECEVVALAEIRPKLAQAVATRYNIPRVYATHEELLANEKLDGIVASQPFQRHAFLLPELYKGVKNVFTEKPLAVTVENGKKLAKAAEAAKCTHMVGYHKRSDPATMYAKDLIEKWQKSGKYGKLRYVRIAMPAGDWVANGFTGHINSGEPYAADLKWETKPAGMTQDIWDKLNGFVNYYIHQVNLMRHLLGEDYKVTYTDKGDAFFAIASASGVGGVVETSAYTTSIAWEETALVAFEHGYIKLSLPAPVTVHRAGTVEIYEDPGNGVTPIRTFPTMPWVHAMWQQAINFVKVCQGKGKPLCTAAEAVKDLEVARDFIKMRHGK
jgi:predicted dehydrogenase